MALLAVLSVGTADEAVAGDGYVAVDEFTYEWFGNELRLKWYTGDSVSVTVPSEVMVSGSTVCVTTVCDTAFGGNGTIESVYLSEGIRILEPEAFQGCTSLESVRLPSSLVSIGTSSFKGCMNLESIDIPTGVGTVPISAFEGCTSLKTISASHVTMILDRAFRGCTSLESISLGSLKSLGPSAFEGCSALRTVSIQNLSSIPEKCFKDCSSLESIVIPEDTKEIWDYSFYGCSSLKTITVLNEFLSDGDIRGEHAFSLGISSENVVCVMNSVSYAKGLFHPDLFTKTAEGDTYTEFRYNMTEFRLNVVCAGVSYTNSLTAGSDLSIEKDGCLISLSDFVPEREGYTFNGWDITVPEHMPAHDMTIQAKWVADRYTVTFMPGSGGIGDQYTQIFDYDTAMYLLKNRFFSESGFFSEWLDYEGNIYADGSLVHMTKDTVLTAQWSPASHQVVYDPGDGSGSMYATPFNEEEVVLSENRFFRIGYTFKYWICGDAVYYDGASCRFGSSVVLTAVWSPITYTIELMTDDGETRRTVVEYDQNYTIPDVALSRTGYKFSGDWVIESMGVEYHKGAIVKNLSTIQDSTVVLKPKWEPNTYYLCFNPNSDGVTGEMDIQTVSYGQTVEINPASYTKKFYDFGGWALTPGGPVAYADCQEISDLTVIDGENISLYAVWVIGTYHVIYDPGDGDGELMEFPWVAYFQKYVIPECTYTYEGHVFRGWVSELDGRVYHPGDEVENLSDGYSQISLIAEWASEDGSGTFRIGAVMAGILACVALAVFLWKRH